MGARQEILHIERKVMQINENKNQLSAYNN